MSNYSKVVLYDPSVASLNMGDHIIAASAREQLEPLLRRAFAVDVSTHLPVSLQYMRHMRDANHKFVLGSNLLRGRMNGIFRQWDIHLANAFMVGPATLMGVGWWQYGDEPNRYTKTLYKRVLEPSAQHSVRDSYTGEMLASMGFDNVIVTACPTMWKLTPEHCAAIPDSRVSEVVCTLTDYNTDPTSDRALIRTLLDEYERVHVWIQGYKDEAYLASLGFDDPRLTLVAPRLADFDEVLDSHDVDYVGTRLHAGIRALQRGRRALIVAIDNRAREKHVDFNLDVVERGDTTEVRSWISGRRPVSLTVPWDAITRWKSAQGL